MKNVKIISLLLAVSLIASVMFVPALGAPDVEGLLKNAIGELRSSSQDEQEAAIKAVEAENAAVVSKGVNEAPWSNILGILLTDEICGKQTSVRTLVLESIRGKEIEASKDVSSQLEEKIASLKLRNDAINTDFNLDGVSVSESAAKYTELENELTSIYGLYVKIMSELEAQSATLKVGGETFTGITSAQVESMFSERIANLFKDLNSLMFAGKDTWEAAYEKLLCGENKITMGLILGSEAAASLASADVMQRVYDYIDSSDVLETVAGYSASLYSNNFETSKTALYNLLQDVMNDILSLEGMESVKAALDDAGWSVDKIISALKTANDAGDVSFYSRAINLNMVLGRYLGVYKKGALQSPVLVNVFTAADDEYDVCVAKSSYKASVLNVLDTAVLNSDGTPSAIVTADDDGRLKFTAADSDVAEGYMLGFWRNGAEKNVYNYISEKTLNVINDDTIHVESVTIKQGYTIDIYVGESKTLEAVISPSNATDKSVIWSSANPKIAKVLQDGKITGVATGKTTITVKTADGDFTATITVNVKAKSGTQYGGGESEPKPTAVPNPPTTPDGASHFVDLEGHWAYAELDELIKEGIVSGYGGDNLHFMPDAPITRAEFAVVMCKMMQLPLTREGVSYSDTINHWSRDYVATVTKYGYMIGVAEDLFAPDLIIPREQVIAVILRAMAFSHNIMHEGDEITNDANDILNLVKEHFGYEYTDLSAEITDIEEGSDWARAYVEMAYKGGYVKGYEDHTMRPLNNATRAEAMIMAKRVIMD